jgi:hypothetical protein
VTVDSDRDQARAFAEREAQRERRVGLSDGDASAAWLSDRGASRTYRCLGDDTAAWRSKPPSVAQIALLRELGVNPLSVRSSGAASDAIQKAKRERRGGKR